jgi:MYXO-CTERM domain-containing protein
MNRKTSTFLQAIATAGLFCAAQAASAAIELTDQPGVSASANSCYLQANCSLPGQYAARNAIDNTIYSSGLHRHNAWGAASHGTPSAPKWLRVDLGQLAQLESVSVRFAFNADLPIFHNVYGNDYTLLGSADGSSWAVLGTGTILDSSNLALSMDTHTWAAGAQPQARFLEYRVTGGLHWASLDEINAMGSYVSAVPEASSWAMLLAGLAVVGGLQRRRLAR